MKALFVHDHIFYKKDNEFFSPGGLPAFAWNRYLKNVDQLTVVSRGSFDSQKSGLVLSSTQCVNFDLLYNVRGGLDYYKYRKSIEAKLREHIEKVDFVVIRVPSTIGYFAYKICKQMNVPFVSEVVGCAWDSTWNYGSFLIKMQAPIGFLQMKSIIKDSIAATYVTKFFLQKRYPTRAKIITYASNVQIPLVADEILDKRLSDLKKNESQHIFNIGIIGNLSVKYKGYDVALQSLSNLKRLYPQIKFVFHLVGGGDASYVNSLIKKFNMRDYCRIVGRLKAGKEVFEFLDSLDLYLHPSRQEGLPRAVIEAMSRGCPVLASSIAGIPELLAPEFLHKPGDSKKLSDDIIAVLSDVNLREKMAITNFKTAKEYNKEILEERREAFFNAVVSTLS